MRFLTNGPDPRRLSKRPDSLREESVTSARVPPLQSAFRSSACFNKPLRISSSLVRFSTVSFISFICSTIADFSVTSLSTRFSFCFRSSIAQSCSITTCSLKLRHCFRFMALLVSASFSRDNIEIASVLTSSRSIVVSISFTSKSIVWSFSRLSSRAVSTSLSSAATRFFITWSPPSILLSIPIIMPSSPLSFSSDAEDPPA
mmetsp:Transcript_26184/g.60197  ORF Transcript_26184/g.60197 Transcript_26184/m.60197 type:complete len:202 (+) Transcript_26184:1044-1649(+)